jgi:hypothetical protein
MPSREPDVEQTSGKIRGAVQPSVLLYTCAMSRRRCALWLTAMVAGACAPDGPEGVGRPDGAISAADAGTFRPGDDGGAADPGIERLEVAAVETAVPLGGRTPLVARASGPELPASGADVTDSVRWTVEPARLGRVSGGEFVAGLSVGTAQIRAELDGVFGATEVQVRVEARASRPVDGTDPLPEDPAAVFASAQSEPERAPAVLYPTDGTLLPRNLGQLEVHFRDRGFDLFEIRFESSTVDVAVTTRCEPLEDGCVFPLEEALYQELSDAAAGRGPVRLWVRGTDGEETADSEPVRVSFSAESVEGGLYYWSTSDEAIMRVDFGAGNVPERFFPFDEDNTCYGCHALSPDGTRMTLSREGQFNGELFLLDVQTRQIVLNGLETDQREQFQSWAPDSSKFAAIWSDTSPPDTRIRIRSGETGQVLEEIQLGHEPTHPNWSPAGDAIAYTRVTEHKTSQRPERGGISVVESLPGGGWSAPIHWIEPEDGFNYYNPEFGLDGSFMLYNRSVCPDGRTGGSQCDGDADPSAELWALASPDDPRIRLDRANAAGPLDPSDALTNTFPRWAPFEGDRFRDGSGRVWWMTFSSRRRYGLRSPPGDGQLLWMAAVDPDAILRGEDGSFPAFALPFQDLGTSNHIGQWTQRIVPTDPDPGNPRPDPDPECAPSGGRCDESRPCCEGLACSADGICVPNL